MKIIICSLLLNLRKDLTSEVVPKGESSQWSEFVDNLWKVHLPHLREGTHRDFVYDAKRGDYGFKEELSVQGESEDDLRFDSCDLDEDSNSLPVEQIERSDGASSVTIQSIDEDMSK